MIEAMIEFIALGLVVPGILLGPAFVAYLAFKLTEGCHDYW